MNDYMEKVYLMQYLGKWHTKRIYVLYLKFKFHWVFCIFSLNVAGHLLADLRQV